MEPTRRNLFHALAALGASLAPATFSPLVVRGAPGRQGQARVPVLVELFTSQGCSSCPPADTLLARLVEEQPVSGVEIAGLSHHVDYWNRLGWTDPYSTAAATERQVLYQRRFQTSSVYTPQMVVDGTHEFVGSDARKALAVIREAARAPRHTLAVEEQASGLSVTVAASAEGPAVGWRGRPLDCYRSCQRGQLRASWGEPRPQTGAPPRCGEGGAGRHRSRGGPDSPSHGGSRNV